MRKLKEFIKDTQKYRLMYALCWLFDLPYLFEESKNSKLRNFSYKCYDWCYEKYDRTQHPMAWAEDMEEGELLKERTVTPCGCTMFDCTECGSYAACNHD